MTAKISASRRTAFLTALRATGNQTIAAERAKVSRSWVCKWRALDPEFDAACREAINRAKQHFDRLSASGAGSRKPHAKWAYLDGEELVVRGTGGSFDTSTGSALRMTGGKDSRDPSTSSGRTGGRERGRPQIARARLHGWSPRTEERFLGALAATCNVKAACAEVGLTPASAYGHRLRWPAFARRWHAAVALGYDRIEAALIEAGCNLFSPELPDDLPPIRGMTFDNAIRLLHMHKHAARGLGSRPGLPPREPDIEEIRATIVHRLAVFERAARS